MIKRVLVALALGVGLLAVTAAPSSAEENVPAITKKYAKQMRCKWPEKETDSDAGGGVGVECVVLNGKIARTEFNIIRYRNITRAVDWWRDWLSYDKEYGPNGYFVRRGKVIITDQSPTGDGYYGEPESKYAARRIDGKLMVGYPY